jgi:hypothetical protein
MSIRRYGELAIILLLWFLAGYGCSGYGKAKPQPVAEETRQDSVKRIYQTIEIKPAETVTIQDLKADWRDYSIHYADVYSIGPAVLLFDPKQDNKTVQADDWIKVENQKTLSEVVDNIRRGLAPKLFSILGADGQFYGYIFYAYKHNEMEIYVSIKPVDTDTLRVAGTSVRGYAPP